MAQGLIRSIYCDGDHRLADGVPVGHKCRVLDPAFLLAESQHDLDGMCEALERMKIVLHEGIRDPLDPANEPIRSQPT